MSKFNIRNDCNFGAPYRLHPKSISDKSCWVGFQFKSSYFGKNFSSIQDLACILVQGGLVLDYI